MLKLNITIFSKMCGIGYSTAKDWKVAPKWVPLVLNYLELVENTDINYKDKLIKKVQAIDSIKKILADI